MVDDIADDHPGGPQEKLALLDPWRTEIESLYSGTPSHSAVLALREPVRRFHLRREDLLAVIDGMAMDARNEMVRPSDAALILYCDRVAAAVGRSTLRIFGLSGLDDLACHLGLALQLTNILRDLNEDAGRGRLYLPNESLLAHGILDQAPDAVLAHPALPALCADLAARARTEFSAAAAILCAHRQKALRPVALMASLYLRLLDRLEESGWASPIRLSLWDRLSRVLRWMILSPPWDSLKDKSPSPRTR